MAFGKVFQIAFAINASMSGSFAGTMNQSAQMMRGLSENTRFLNSEQRRLDAVFREGSMSMAEYRANMQRLRGEMDATRAASNGLRNAQAAQAAARARFSNATSGLMNAGMNVAMAAAPVVGIIATAANFEQAMSKVQAITRADNDEIKQLTETARELGEKTQFSAKQSADAMSYLGMAGWNAEQIIAGMPGLLNLAAAGGTDLARTADIVSDDLTAFGLSAESTDHMADVFAVTVTRTNTNVEMLGETMKYAAPVAHMFGASMEETAALAGLMANSGIKATQAGTSLRAGFLRLAGPPKMAADAMASLGMSMQDITDQQKEAAMAMASLGISMEDTDGPRKMSAVLTELRDKTEGMGREEKMAALGAIFGKNAVTGWMAVLEAGPETFNKLVDEMENCDGEAARMAEVMNNNARGAAIRLKSAAESLAISIGSVFLPVLANMLDGVANATGGMSRWAAEHPMVTQGVIGLGAALMGLYLYMKITAVASAALALAQTTLKASAAESAAAQIFLGNAQKGASIATRAAAGAQWLLNAAMTANPVGLVIAAIAALIAIGYVLYANFDKVRAFMATIWESPIAAILAFTNPIFMLMYLGAGIISNWETVKAWFVTLWEDPSAALSQFTGFIGGKLSMAWAAVTGFAAGIGASISAAWTYVTDEAGQAWNAITGAISAALAGAGTAIVSGFQSLVSFIVALPGMFIFAIGFIAGVISTLPGKVLTAITAVGAFLYALPGYCMTAGAAFVAAAAAWLSETYNEATTWITTTAITVAMLLAMLPGYCMDAGAAFIAAAIAWLSEAYTNTVAWLSNLLASASAFLYALPGKCAAAGAAFVAAAEAWASSAYDSVMNWINQIPGAISSALSGAWDSIKAQFSGGFSVGVQAASNARGGIYQKGAFLTTFAEESAEAAIPLDGSPRAIGLWQKAGQLLGVGSQSGTTPALEKGPSFTKVAPGETGAPHAIADDTQGNDGVTQQIVHTVEQEKIAPPPIELTLNFYGPAEPIQVSRAVKDAARTVQRSFAEQMEEFQRERGRVAFE